MLFFNYDNLLKAANHNPFKVVEILKAYHAGRLLKYYKIKSKLKGNSFLINPDAILNEKYIDILYVHQYIQLAARRDYSLYSLYGITSLPLSHFPDIRLDSLKTNPLLKVTNSEIIFKYEG